MSDIIRLSHGLSQAGYIGNLIPNLYYDISYVFRVVWLCII